jgi:GNAT superfamily N-acetyltransferase
MVNHYHIQHGFEDTDRAAIVTLLREYEAALGVSLCFQDFDAEIASLPGAYAPPGGQMLLARDPSSHVLVGCVALRPADGRRDTCEMKRLYVRPQARGTGLGRHLAVAAMEEARRLGYRRMFLDTLPKLHEARTLYQTLGFREIGMAGTDPVVVLYERDLSSP